MPSTEIKAAMSHFEYFKKWDEATIAQCCNLAKIKKYTKDKIILGDSVGFPNYVYFVLTGECRILEELFVIKNKSRKGAHYRLYIPSEEQLESINYDQTKDKVNYTSLPSKFKVSGANNCLPINVEVHFVQVCILKPLSCFGFGEQMERRRVITTSNTECLLIPFYWLMQQNINNIWNRIQIFLKKFLPTTEEVFKEFVSQRLWNKNSQKLTLDIISKVRRSSNNSLYNVPYYVRINRIT